MRERVPALKSLDLASLETLSSRSTSFVRPFRISSTTYGGSSLIDRVKAPTISR